MCINIIEVASYRPTDFVHIQYTSYLKAKLKMGSNHNENENCIKNWKTKYGLKQEPLWSSERAQLHYIKKF